MSNYAVSSKTLRENLMLIIGVCLCVYFSYHLLVGDRGYLRHLSLKKTISTQQIILTSLYDDRYAIEKKVKMMRPDHLDYDLLSERVRRVLGYILDDEVVIMSEQG